MANTGIEDPSTHSRAARQWTEKETKSTQTRQRSSRQNAKSFPRCSLSRYGRIYLMNNWVTTQWFFVQVTLSARLTGSRSFCWPSLLFRFLKQNIPGRIHFSTLATISPRLPTSFNKKNYQSPAPPPPSVEYHGCCKEKDTCTLTFALAERCPNVLFPV